MDLMLFMDVFLCFICLFGATMMMWWWRKVGKATNVYLYTIVVFLGLTIGSILHVLLINNIIPQHFGFVTPVVLACGVLPIVVRMTRRAWIFTHSTEEVVQESLKLMVCPLLGTYCAALARKRKKEAKDDDSKAKA